MERISSSGIFGGLARPAVVCFVLALPMISCIYDAPGDRFYRTLWTSGDVTLEFLCDGCVCVRAAGAAGSYGTYEPHGTTAFFSNLSLNGYRGESPFTIEIKEADRMGDRLCVMWCYVGSMETFVVEMTRKSSY